MLISSVGRAGMRLTNAVLFCALVIASPSTSQMHMSKDAAARCLSTGGSITDMQAGQGCVHKTVDGGKTCTANAQCSAHCLWRKPQPWTGWPKRKVSGYCALDDSPMDCSAWVDKGRVIQPPCA